MDFPGQEPRLDAGNKHHDHYAQRLPQWRNALRQRLLPIVRRETHYLALLQDKMRSPALDSYFAYTANLGTHTFFMVFLPIQFWCGYTSLGRATVFMLAAGIYWSGFLKDMLCLPRPQSPPLARISMSGSAALEYGFPSSHSTNAVSITFYVIHTIRQSPDQHDPYVYIGLQAAFYFYALSIIFGRLYCGMHGFLDVVVGSTLGALITVFQLACGEWMNSRIFSGSYVDIVIATLIIFVLVRIHPEPADDCPCFDDSVAFSGVLVGINLGGWHFAQTRFAVNDPIPSTVPFDLQEIGIVKAVVRVVLGVVMIFVWRATMKKTLFRILPPFFRLLERARLNLPRAFFLSASKYTSIPPLRDDDNVIPPISELPHMLRNLTHPRKRAVSFGPQSAADAYETLAYRNRKRAESITSHDGTMPEGITWSPSPRSPALEKGEQHLGANVLPTPMTSRVHSYEQIMGTENVQPQNTTSTPPDSDSDVADKAIDFMQSSEEAANEKREIFMKLTKPRVRYDVEVVTKLIVYSGIGWIAVEAAPVVFELVGLGMGRSP
ncbi:PAP2-domain-containing protein [Dothidotthia symphoricarpi CBS 119687]|uniref:PAP2-domain-containing protein n=1 Tax=Dothidotthia symphoricarpi CBS 119687 TaxID=1392245 RepID=A0A6A6ABW8_9PLEO|nr:PAP2-domain-containing protein [Dothidotthia symphoricarpi CBS 119687]KAF2129280.1 PAP2-domain-containing protein [Dothidotthia symphoricarpi CBS 119687]